MRNVWCRNYNQCLDQVALKDGDNFSCDDCPMAEDTGGQVREPAAVREESLKCARLLFKVFPKLEGRYGPVSFAVNG